MMHASWLSFRRRSLVLVCVVAVGFAAQMRSQEPSDPLELVKAMVVREDNNAAHRDCYEFLSNERSDRTGGHMWTERVVEIPAGRLRLLVGEDGKPLPAERQQRERERLAAIVANPDEFVRREQAQRDDEAHARVLLGLLAKGYLFDNVRLKDGVWRMDWRPNPGYSPSGMEERVLHGMSGWVEIDERDVRLIHIEGKLPQDVSIGFGLLATIHAGSGFGSDRREEGGHWRTVHVATDIRGKAALFKNVSRNTDITRSEFVYLEPGITLGQAVALVERQ
jgi:hypothetical protein